ncbi:MAG TPA: SIMPL domain-containing protein [Labilithrix sp.]|nr:SIMPL domain-containing protein [Labilithrix sp.]
MTVTSPLSLLQVSEQAQGEVAPSAAVVHVVLIADKLFSGTAALEKAEELRRLAVALQAGGLPEDAIALEGASLDVSTGLFTRSSSVTYRVRVQVADLDRLGDVLDAIAGCKKARLTHLTWAYPAGAPEVLVRECAVRAARKAEVLASALGVVLDGIHAVRDEVRAEAPIAETMLGGGDTVVPRKSRASSIADELGGLDLAPKRSALVRVFVDYRIKR